MNLEGAPFLFSVPGAERPVTKTWRGEKENMMDGKIRIILGTLRLGQKKVVTYSSAFQEM